MTNDTNSPVLLVIGQFPPPVNGFSYITQELAALLSARYRTAAIDLTPHHEKRKIFYHLRRMALALAAAGTILKYAGQSSQPNVYLACEGGYGLVYTFMLAMCAQAIGAPVYLHHHSFYYIDRRFPLMALLLKTAGPRIAHIFLSPDMAQKFSNRYRLPIKSIVLSNSAFVEAAKIEKTGPANALTIGLLSNLNEEKGLGRFIETLRMAKANDLNVKGILAGPARDEQDRQTIENAQRELGDRLSYRGPVYGDAKQAFYKDIDVFVFPTAYPNEAQPTVIFEAMANGVPVLSCDRGCIKGQVTDFGAVCERNADFPAFATAQMAQWLVKPETFADLRLDTLSHFLKDSAAAREVAANLLSQTPQIIEPT